MLSRLVICKTRCSERPKFKLIMQIMPQSLKAFWERQSAKKLFETSTRKFWREKWPTTTISENIDQDNKCGIPAVYFVFY